MYVVSFESLFEQALRESTRVGVGDRDCDQISKLNQQAGPGEGQRKMSAGYNCEPHRSLDG